MPAASEPALSVLIGFLIGAVDARLTNKTRIWLRTENLKEKSFSTSAVNNETRPPVPQLVLQARQTVRSSAKDVFIKSTAHEPDTFQLCSLLSQVQKNPVTKTLEKTKVLSPKPLHLLQRRHVMPSYVGKRTSSIYRTKLWRQSC